MNVKERVLAIRLMEKLEKHCGYAKRLGVDAAVVKVDSKEKRL